MGGKTIKKNNKNKLLAEGENTLITAEVVSDDYESEENEGNEGNEEEAITSEIEALPAAVLPGLLESGDSHIALPIDDSADKGGVVPYDGLTTYMREISRYSVLSREDEHALAVRYKERGDKEAAFKLVSSNLRLVVMIAREYDHAARHLLDLIQEGNIGLLDAVKKYDPYRGVRFPSYAVWWIRAYIVRFLMANLRLVKIGTTQAQRKLFFNLTKEREKLERAGFVVGPKLLAERLDVKESDIIEMEQRLSSADLSVDAPIDGDSENTLHSHLASDQLNSEELFAMRQASEQAKKTVDEFKNTLNLKQRIIFEKRLLAESEDKVTLQDLSVELSISKERVRQIEEQLKTRLKSYLQGNM